MLGVARWMTERISKVETLVKSDFYQDKTVK